MSKVEPLTGQRGKPTIYDIAKATNASPSTVSLVLNGNWSRYRIKQDTAQRIRQSAERLGYNVNLTARGLRTSRSGLAGMILPHYRMRFFAELAEAFEAEARRRGLCPIVVSTQRHPDVAAQVTTTMLAQPVEFLFMAGVPEPAPLNALCKAADIPCVNLDLPGNGAPSVVSDNAGGARRLTERVIAELSARGCTPIDLVYIGGVEGEYASDNRVSGFLAALAGSGFGSNQVALYRCGYLPEKAYQALERHVAQKGGMPAGILAKSSTAFEGVVQFDGCQPRSALETLTVGCCDWDPFAAHLPYHVMMLRQDAASMVAEAFEALAPHRQVNPDLVVVPPASYG